MMVSDAVRSPGGADIPITIMPPIIPSVHEVGSGEPNKGCEAEETSAGAGLPLSPYERVMALLSDTDPSKDIFRVELGHFVAFVGIMIEKILHHGYCFPQFRRSLARRMTMIREEGYPDLADFFTADFVVLEREFQELGELKAKCASSFVATQLESKLNQWHDTRASIGNKLQSQEGYIMHMMANLSRKDKDRAELLSSLASNREKIAKLKKALKYAEKSVVVLEGELADVESSRRQTLDKLKPAQEKLAKLRSEAAKILDISEDSIRANLQAKLEQSYANELSRLELQILSRRLRSD